MSAIRGAFSQIRHFRNRVFHHEPVWPKRDSEPLPKQRYDDILTALRWLSPEQASLTARVHGVPVIFDANEQIPAMHTRLLDAIDQALEVARLRKIKKEEIGAARRGSTGSPRPRDEV